MPVVPKSLVAASDFCAAVGCPYLDTRHQSWSLPAFLSWRGERQDNKGSQLKGGERPLTKYQTDSNLENSVNSLPIKIRAGQGEIKYLLKTPLLHPSLLPSSTSSHPAEQGDRNGGSHYGQFITLMLFLLLLQCGVPPPGDFLNCSSVTPSHGQKFSNKNHFSPGSVLQAQPAPVWVPHKGHKSYQKTCSSLGSSNQLDQDR